MAQHIEYYVTQKKNEAVLHVLVFNTFQDIKGKSICSLLPFLLKKKNMNIHKT